MDQKNTFSCHIGRENDLTDLQIFTPDNFHIWKKTGQKISKNILTVLTPTTFSILNSSIGHIYTFDTKPQDECSVHEKGNFYYVVDFF